MMNGLILIDLQNDYFPGGKMELTGIEAAAQNARRLLDRCRRTGGTAIHIQHLSIHPGATFFQPETAGAQINSTVASQEDETVVAKNYPNAFRDTTLSTILKQQKIGDIILCGAMSHMCIDATVRAAFDLGFDCTVAADACATKNLTFADRVVQAADVHASFMAALSGTYASVLTTRDILETIT